MVKSYSSLFSPNKGFLTHCTYWTHHTNQHFLSTLLWPAKAVVCFKIYIKTVSALKRSNSPYLSTSLRPKYFYGQPQNTIRFITTASLTWTSTVPAWRVFWRGSWVFYLQLHSVWPKFCPQPWIFTESQMWGHHLRAESVPRCLGTKW